MAEHTLDSFFPSRHTLPARFSIHLPLITKALHGACLLLAVGFIGLFLGVALLSVGYPFQLEWMEGAMIDIVQRVREGLPIYAKPSLEYVPFPYTPLYFYVSAAMSWLTGVDFLPARLVSLLAALATLLIIARWVQKEGSSKGIALIAAGLFAASYQLTGRWFDVARVDSLFLALTLGALYWLFYHRGFKHAAFTAALMCAAFFTKQTAAIVFAPVLLAMLAVDRRHAWQVIVPLALALLFIIGIFNVSTDYWFKFFVFELQSGHEIQAQHVGGFWTRDLFPHTALTLLLSLAALALLAVQDWKKGLLYTALGAGLVLCSYAARINWGSYLNVLMPAYAACALLCGLALARLQERKMATLVALGIICIQMVTMLYDPRPMVPDAKAREAGERFLKQLATIQGEVLIPERQFVQTRVGKKSYTLGMAAYDLLTTNMRQKNVIRFELEQEIADAIAKKRFAAIMAGGLVDMPDLEDHYMPRRKMDFPPEYVTGATNFLRKQIFVPKSQTKLPLTKPDLHSLPE